MGRYYSGDIEGKFWFAVQSSTAADRFGVNYSEPSYVEYYYCDNDLPLVVDEIDSIIENLGNKLKLIDDFFENNVSYTDKDFERIGIYKEDLKDYADLKLGEKIRDCIIETGECYFKAEL